MIYVVHNLEGPPPVYRLKVLTDCYTELFEAVQQANSFYRSQVLATVSSALIHNIITLYFLILDLQRPVISYLVLSQFAWALSRVAHIVLLLWPCASLSQAVSGSEVRDDCSVGCSFMCGLRNYRILFRSIYQLEFDL